MVQEFTPSRNGRRVGDRGFWLQTGCAPAALNYSEAERLKEESRAPRREGRIVHELGRARNRGAGDRKLEKDAEGRGRSRWGESVFMVVEKAARPVRVRLPRSGDR
jgi:hypothetical protein